MSLSESIAYYEHHYLRERMHRWLKPRQLVKAQSAGRHIMQYLLSKEDLGVQVIQFPKRKIVNGIEFRSPVGIAAGYDKVGKLVDISYNQGAGYMIVGSLTAKKRDGNVIEGIRHPCLLLPDGSAVNCLGLPNPGYEGVKVESKYKAFPVGISLSEDNQISDDAERVRALLTGFDVFVAQAAFFELNLSCPNTGEKIQDSAQFYYVVDTVGDKLRQLRSVEDKNIVCYAKFSVDTPLEKLEEIIPFLYDKGFSGINLGNTSTKDLKYKVLDKDKEAYLWFKDKIGGGVSGPLIHHLAFNACKTARDVIDDFGLGGQFTLIGTGGITHAADVNKFLYEAGCDLVQRLSGHWDGFSRSGHLLYQHLYSSLGWI